MSAPATIPESLKVGYAERLAHAITLLERFVDQCERGKVQASLVSEVQAMTHRLHGSGATLGFAALSVAAAALENVLEGDPLSARVDARTLAAICHHTISMIAEKCSPKLESAAQAEVLLVCDSSMLSRDVTDALMGLANVNVAAFAPEAEQAMFEKSIKVVIADFNNPKCPADVLKDVIREADDRGLPIIGLTSSMRDAAVAHAVSDGKITCLTKPLNADKLRAKISSLLGPRKRRVILGDDDRIVRELLRSRFEAGGFEVVRANDGEEVLAQAQAGGVDIIVLDRGMPKLDGMTALRMLKADPRTHRIPVVMLTAKASPEQVREGRRDGASAYMLKPFSPDEVVLRCVEVLDGETSGRTFKFAS